MLAHSDAPQTKAIQQVLDALKHTQVRMLVVDDADSLTGEVLAEPLMLSEKPACTLLLIGISSFPAGFDAPEWVATRVVDPLSAHRKEEES